MLQERENDNHQLRLHALNKDAEVNMLQQVLAAKDEELDLLRQQLADRRTLDMAEEEADLSHHVSDILQDGDPDISDAASDMPDVASEWSHVQLGSDDDGDDDADDVDATKMRRATNHSVDVAVMTDDQATLGASEGSSSSSSSAIHHDVTAWPSSDDVSVGTDVLLTSIEMAVAEQISDEGTFTEEVDVVIEPSEAVATLDEHTFIQSQVDTPSQASTEPPCWTPSLAGMARETYGEVAAAGKKLAAAATALVSCQSAGNAPGQVQQDVASAVAELGKSIISTSMFTSCMCVAVPTVFTLKATLGAAEHCVKLAGRMRCLLM
eukprot:jgi/Chrzof1/2406/Cz11g14070.t1